MASTLDEILAKLSTMPDASKKEVLAQSAKATKDLAWIPNPGPQTDAFFSEADELFFGGQAGGGKTALSIGLALTQHKRALILRRIKGDAAKIVPMIADVLGTRDGYNGQDHTWRIPDGRQIDINGCEYEDDKQRFKGDPHDLIAYDELTDFTGSQYRFINGWNRSVDPNQRCRVVGASNPPTTAEGRWVISYWGPWLDPKHPNPAKPGELRWYTTIEGVDTEVDGPGPHIIPGEPEPILARSRTFIPSSLSDNPDLARTNYASVLASLPDELRRAYRDGDFTVGLKDRDFQVIPTAWVQAAQERWTPDGYKGNAMTAMALDPAGGGNDAAELVCRYGGWYAQIETMEGKGTADGSLTGASVVKHRRDGCPIVVDVGGGYAGAVIERFKDNDIPYSGFNGAADSTAKTKDGTLQFANKRAEAHWRLREELDPTQEGGSAIALPPGNELLADLTATTWKLTAKGILLNPKDEIRKLLGRSPGKGDVVVMTLSEGNKAAMKRAHKLTNGRAPRTVTKRDLRSR